MHIMKEVICYARYQGSGGDLPKRFSVRLSEAEAVRHQYSRLAEGKHYSA